MLHIIIRGGQILLVSGAGSVPGIYAARRAAKKRKIRRVEQSGLLDVAKMDLGMVDLRRALDVIELSDDSLPANIDDIGKPRLRVAARELEGLAKAYSSFRKESERYGETARNNFYSSLGVRIYIDNRYIEQKPLEEFPAMSEFSRLIE